MDGLPGRTFDQVVQGRDGDDVACSFIHKRADVAKIRSSNMDGTDSGRGFPDSNEAFVRIKVLVQRRGRIVRKRGPEFGIGRAEESSIHRHQMRRKEHARPRAFSF